MKILTKIKNWELEEAIFMLNDILSKLKHELEKIDNGKFYCKIIDRLLKQKKEYWKLVEKIQNLEDEIKKNEKEREI